MTMVSPSLRLILQHLPDFKGIETGLGEGIQQIIHLQHLPDFKGIETG